MVAPYRRRISLLISDGTAEADALPQCLASLFHVWVMLEMDGSCPDKLTCSRNLPWPVLPWPTPAFSAPWPHHWDQAPRSPSCSTHSTRAPSATPPISGVQSSGRDRRDGPAPWDRCRCAV